MHAVILVMAAWLSSPFLVGCFEDHSQPEGDMKHLAETAIKDAGGADVLEKDAKVILSNFRLGSDWKVLTNGGSNCPAITKAHALLSPYGHGPWVAQDTKDLPAHVVIRFGTHRHYEYVWIFDPEHVPLGEREGVQRLSGAVYLSGKNE